MTNCKKNTKRQKQLIVIYLLYYVGYFTHTPYINNGFAIFQACREARYAGNSHRILGPQGGGVHDSDFVLYISVNNTERCSISNTVGYAAYCQLEAATDRYS